MMADDPADHGILLYGGTSLATSAILNDTWLFRSGVWTEICSGTTAAPACSTSPSPRIAAQLAYDPADHSVLLFGGAKSFSDVNDTWLFANGSWRNVTGAVAPPPGDSLPVASDAAGGVLLITNRNHVPETWEYGAAGWTRQLPTTTPSVADLQPMWFDARLDADVLWDQGSGTWAFVSGEWTKLSVTGSPPAAGGFPSGGGYDSSAGYGFVYAPSDSARTTWTFSAGIWTNVTANVSSGPATTTPLGVVYDTTDGYVLAAEDTGTALKDVQTWILHDPFTVRLNDSDGVQDVGQSTSLYLTIFGGIAPYGTTVLSEPPGCGPPSNATNETLVPCVMVRTGTFDLTVLVHDVRDLYLRATLAVTVAPTLGASGYATPNPASVGDPVSFFTNVSGGAPPYSIAWTVPGQATRTGPSFTTSFSSPQNLSVQLSVTDAAQSRWAATFPIVILTAIGVAASANRTSTDVGVPVRFTANVEGGVPPTATNWTFGDGTVGVGSNVTHAYPSAGDFTADVVGTDGLGSRASAIVNVTVHSPLRARPTGPATSVPTVATPVTLSAGIWGGTPPFVVSWDFGDGQHSNLTDPSPTFAAAGNATVTITVTDAVGQRATGRLVLDVATSSNGSAPPPGGTASDGPALYASIGLVVAGAVGATALWFVRRGRRASP
jgi:hypothetical protein